MIYYLLFILYNIKNIHKFFFRYFLLFSKYRKEYLLPPPLTIQSTTMAFESLPRVPSPFSQSFWETKNSENDKKKCFFIMYILKLLSTALGDRFSLVFFCFYYYLLFD